MHKKNESKLNNGLNQDYTTIDDAIRLTKELLAQLSQLGEYRYSLVVRRGRKEVVNVVAQDDQSKTIKAGSKTYFFDINRTKDGKYDRIVKK